MTSKKLAVVAVLGVFTALLLLRADGFRFADAATQSTDCRSEAPSNPWGYDFCSPGDLIVSPPSNFCSYFRCIGNFWNGAGYVIQCRDGMFSKSGGRSGSCSYHGGNARALYSHPRRPPTAAQPLSATQNCMPSGRVSVTFRWAPSTWFAAGHQWVDLSIFNNGFIWGTFIGSGPFVAWNGEWRWDGLLPNTDHYWRVNTYMGLEGNWVASGGYYLRTIAC
jgi:hypothetical protein